MLGRRRTTWDPPRPGPAACPQWMLGCSPLRQRPSAMLPANKPPRILLLVVLGLPALVFAPALLGGYVYDDELLIARHGAPPLALALSRAWTEPFWGSELGYWRPLTAMLLRLGHGLGGALAIHLFALLFHVAAAGLAFLLARRLLGSDRLAAAAALLFALHPITVESVAWAAAINDVLAATLGLGACVALLANRDRTPERVPWRAGLAFALALLAKERALMHLPLLLLLERLAPRATAPAPGRMRRVATLLLAVLALYVLARMLVFGELTAGFGRAPIEAGSTGIRAWLAPAWMLGRFLELLVVPLRLTPFRTLPAEFDALTLLRSGVWILALASLLLFGWRHRIVRLALLFMLLPLVAPLVRFREIGAFPVADRFVHLGAFGLGLLLAATFAQTSRRAPRSSLALLAILLLGAAALSTRQILVWRDGRHLVAHGLALTPENPTLHVMSGNLTLRHIEQQLASPARDQTALRQDLATARAAFEEALRLAPLPNATDPRHRAYAEAWLGLGWCTLLAVQLGEPLDPSPAFERALTAAPDLAQAHIGLGIWHGMRGAIPTAEHHLLRAIELDPDRPEAHWNLAYLYLRTNRPTKARHQAAIVLELDPTHHDARALLKTPR